MASIRVLANVLDRTERFQAATRLRFSDPVENTVHVVAELARTRLFRLPNSADEMDLMQAAAFVFNQTLGNTCWDDLDFRETVAVFCDGVTLAVVHGKGPALLKAKTVKEFLSHLTWRKNA